jgi:hypothetical protein
MYHSDAAAALCVEVAGEKRSLILLNRIILDC